MSNQEKELLEARDKNELLGNITMGHLKKISHLDEQVEIYSAQVEKLMKLIADQKKM